MKNLSYVRPDTSGPITIFTNTPSRTLRPPKGTTILDDSDEPRKPVACIAIFGVVHKRIFSLELFPTSVCLISILAFTARFLFLRKCRVSMGGCGDQGEGGDRVELQIT
jgi:hypothetical protein